MLNKFTNEKDSSHTNFEVKFNQYLHKGNFVVENYKLCHQVLTSACTFIEE